MKAILAASALAIGLCAGAGAASAKGCLTGAAVGGVAGHYAGHHGVLGAVAGCVINHHRNAVKDERADASRTYRDGYRDDNYPGYATPSGPGANGGYYNR